MATKRRRYLGNAGKYDTINSRYGSGDFYRPVVGPNLPELVVTPYGKISYASTNGDSGTRFLTRDEWLNKNSKTATPSSVDTLNFQKPSQLVNSRINEVNEIINNARNQLIEDNFYKNNRPVYKVGGRKRNLARSSSPAIIDLDTVRYDNMVKRYGYANQFGGNRHHRPGYYSEKVRNSDGSSSIVSYPYVYPYRMENRGSDIMLYDRSGNNIIDVLPAGAVISKGTNDVINRLNSRPVTIPRGIGIVPVDNTYVRHGRRIRRRPMPGIPPRPSNFIGRGGNFGGGGGGDQYSW